MARDRASRPEAKPLRLFVALEVPAELKAAIGDAIAPLRDAFPRARWSPPDNWHVTLKFLGSTWPRLVGWVNEQVSAVAADRAPFATRLTDLGVFPSPNRARVVWAGLDDGRGRMAELALALDHALSSEFKPESRAFRPHLTVGRSEPPLAVRLREEPLDAAPFEVREIVLFRSHLQRPAPRYEPMERFRLEGRLEA